MGTLVNKYILQQSLSIWIQPDNLSKLKLIRLSLKFFFYREGLKYN